MSTVIEPVASGAELVAAIRAARGSGRLHVWRTGQAGVVVVLPSGTTIAVDLYLSDHCEAVLPAPFDHRRLTRSPLTAPELEFLDVVICTHDHLDHLDVPTLRTLARFEHVQMVAPEDCRSPLMDLGWSESRLHLTRGHDHVEVAGGVRVSGFPVPHEEFEIDDAGAPYQGYVVDDGRSSFAHLGDALDHVEVRTALNALADGAAYDVLFVPINGRDEARAALGFAGNTTAEEAVELARSVPVSCTIPIHYDMFAQNVDEAAEQRFRAAARRAELAHAVLAVGETWSPTQNGVTP